MTELWALTAAEIGERVRAGRTTARAAVESALDRLDAVNPAINAVVDRFDDEALAEADALDRRIAGGEDPGPLAGVPVTVKDNVDQKGRPNTNGLRLQKNLVAEADSPVVANFRRAGAVIIGRTNTPAFSLRWFTRNSLHGHTRNPRFPDLTPGGSSGGAGAAVASGIGAIGHGTDIAGSIRYPAYACGVHGLRPSLGRVAAGNFSAPDRHIGAQMMAVSGPLARSVGDLRPALQALSAPDHRDPWWTPAPLEGPQWPRRAALCVAPDRLETAPEIRTGLELAAERLRAAGWEVGEPAIPPLREPMRLQILLWLAEYRRHGGTMIDAEDDEDARHVYAGLVRHAPPHDLDTIMDALQRRVALTRLWRAFFEEWPVLLTPVSAEPPFADLRDVASDADFDAVVESQLPQIAPPFMGLPGLTVTLSVEGDAPSGVQLLASHFREDILLSAGADVAGEAPAPVAWPRGA